jgi:hypothetical protein
MHPPIPPDVEVNFRSRLTPEVLSSSAEGTIAQNQAFKGRHSIDDRRVPHVQQFLANRDRPPVALGHKEIAVLGTTGHR